MKSTSARSPFLPALWSTTKSVLIDYSVLVSVPAPQVSLRRSCLKSEGEATMEGNRVAWNGYCLAGDVIAKG